MTDADMIASLEACELIAQRELDELNADVITDADMQGDDGGYSEFLQEQERYENSIPKGLLVPEETPCPDTVFVNDLDDDLPF